MLWIWFYSCQKFCYLWLLKWLNHWWIHSFIKWILHQVIESKLLSLREWVTLLKRLKLQTRQFDTLTTCLTKSGMLPTHSWFITLFHYQCRTKSILLRNCRGFSPSLPKPATDLAQWQTVNKVGRHSLLHCEYRNEAKISLILGLWLVTSFGARVSTAPTHTAANHIALFCFYSIKSFIFSFLLDSSAALKLKDLQPNWGKKLLAER